MDEKEFKQRGCDHQYSNQGDMYEVPFNYCPWCGQKLPKDESFKDDCIKGGCND